jgi:hypothetical protein
MRHLALATAAGCAALIASPAWAASIQVEVWKVPGSVASNVIPANVPATAPAATFSLGGVLGFDGGGGDTLTQLVSGAAGFGNATGDLSTTANQTFWVFTGFLNVTDGQSFTIRHDDGIDFRIGGVSVIAFPRETPPRDTTGSYTGTSGVRPFTLLYGQNQGNAVLRFDLPIANAPQPPTGVPAPAGAAVLGLGLLGLAAARRRR